MTGPAEIVDGAMDALVVPSFTRIGPAVRRRLFDWADPADDMSDRVVVITGVTTGLGRAAAERMVAAGATVVAVGRDRARTERAADEIRGSVPDGARHHPTREVSVVVADVGDLDEVRTAAEEIRSAHDRVDVLVHNAGALLHERTESAQGLEVTVASQVVGPFLLTHLLLDPLGAASPGRVVTVSSGGMYPVPLTVSGLQMDPDSYDGTRQYALAKRAQVTLNEMWAERIPSTDVVFHAMHPGWADTPGVAASLPTFKRVMGPLLRDPDEGADTVVWLAADDGEPQQTSGAFWLDRRRRPIHRLPTTRRSDTPERRAALWTWVAEQAGVDPTG